MEAAEELSLAPVAPLAAGRTRAEELFSAPVAGLAAGRTREEVFSALPAGPMAEDPAARAEALAAAADLERAAAAVVDLVEVHTSGGPARMVDPRGVQAAAAGASRREAAV